MKAPSTLQRWLRLLRRHHDGMETAEVSVRELAIVFLIAAVVVGSAFMIAYRFVRPAPPNHFVISTGNESGAYHLFAQRYRDLLAQEKIRVELRPSTGSVENLQRLTDPNSGVDVALLQGGIASADQEYPLRSVGAIYYEPLWVFYRGNTELTRLTQFAGKRVAAGPEGSGTRVLAVNMLKASGATGRGLILSPLAGTAAADALVAGRIDAAMFVAAPDAPIVQRLLEAEDIRLMSLTHAEALAQRFGYLSAVTLLRGTGPPSAAGRRRAGSRFRRPTSPSERRSPRSRSAASPTPSRPFGYCLRLRVRRRTSPAPRGLHARQPGQPPARTGTPRD